MSPDPSSINLYKDDLDINVFLPEDAVSGGVIV